MADQSGRQLGNYHLIRLLGSGGFAHVYLAEHIYLKRQVAIKVLHVHLVQQEFPGFLQEAQTIAGLNHANIIPVSDFGIDPIDSTPFLVVEYVPGGSLRDRHPPGTPLPLQMILSYVKQVADALQYAHDAKVIHRDIKPANMLLRSNDQIVLSDFGLAAAAHQTTSLQTMNIAGSPFYMAPEQVAGKPRPASDQYALAMVVYEWLCGKPAFQGAPFAVMYQQMYVPVPSLSQQIPTIVPEVEQVVLKALMKDPQQRFESVRAFAQALAAVFDKLLAPPIPVAIQATPLPYPHLDLAVGTMSDPGLKRKHKPNEDSLFAIHGTRSQNALPQPCGLFVVADGMSERPYGQDASRLAIQTFIDYILPKVFARNNMHDTAFLKLLSNGELPQLLVDGVQAANQAVYQRNKEHRATMGTTMTTALIMGATAYIANVGDSRAYMLRDQTLMTLTRDHSLVARMVEANQMKPEDIYAHPQLNQLYRSLGEKPMVEVDLFHVRLQAGDKLLLCSDGLWHMVRDPEILRLMHTPAPDPLKTANALIQAALDSGGQDNVSVIIIQVFEVTHFTSMTGIQLLAKPDNVNLPNI